mgnify:CR=1 FL=1
MTERRGPGRRVAAGGVALAVALALAGGVAAACPLDEPGAPRLLILALDGVPLRLIERARADGHFTGWSEPAELVSTFPSMSNVAFTAMLRHLGAPPIPGYETRHYSHRDDRVYPGSDPSGYGWKRMFQVVTDTFGEKTSLYLTPGRRARRILEEIEQVLTASERPSVVLAHLSPTDVLMHLRGDAATYRVVVAAAESFERLRLAHRERFGRPLEIVVVSDHGNGAVGEKVRYTDGLRDALRQAGFELGGHLDGPRRIVAPTYGAVNYGPLYLDPAAAAEAAAAAVAHESVDLSAWASGPAEITVLSPGGRARIGWRETGSRERGRRRAFSYVVERGDPLRLLPVRQGLERRGELDDGGFGDEEDWFAASASSPYPDALRRLVDSLSTRYVANPATVILSLGPRWAWGQGSVRFGSRLQGGKLEATHGGLDRESSQGFLIASDRQRQSERVISAEQALLPWPYLGDCVSPETLAAAR